MKSVEEIYEEMLGAFCERAGVEVTQSCDLAVRLYAAAAQIQALQHQSEWVLRQCFPQTAQAEALDHHGALRNLSRRASAKAHGEITFSVTQAAQSAIAVAEGTVCMTESGVRFITLEKGTIVAGERSCTVKAEAVECGSSGNVAAGSIVKMSVLPTGVEQCANEKAFSGGTEEETDEEFRTRVLESFRRLPNGANAAYYELQAENHAGVRSAKAVGRARGVGTVDVYIAAESGLPSESLLREVCEDLSGKREIAVDLQVLAPQTEQVDVAAELTVAEGYDFADVKAAAETALRSFFAADLLGRAVTRAALGDLLYHIEGVENYVITTPQSDLAAAATVLPMLGTVTLEEAAG